MKTLIVLLLYIVFAFILGVVSYILKKKHTQFPDFRVGYHHKKLMENKETWESANNIAGNACAIFSGVGILLSLLLYFSQTEMGIALILFFIYAFLSIAVILVLPVQLSKK